MFQRIVVPLDGSDVAEQALGPGAELASRLGVPLRLMRVVDMHQADVTTMFGYMADGRMMAEQVKSEVQLAREYLSENVRSLEEQGLRVSAQVDVGVPAAAIIDTAQEGDCIVMASHGRSGIARWYIGSVAEQVMRQAQVPVMVVRGPSSPHAHADQERLAVAS